MCVCLDHSQPLVRLWPDGCGGHGEGGRAMEAATLAACSASTRLRGERRPANQVHDQGWPKAGHFGSARMDLLVLCIVFGAVIPWE